jgi:hypothetical protein
MKEQQIIFFHNELNAEMFEGNDISVLQDLWLPFLEHLFKTEIIEFFHESTWGNGLWKDLLSESHPVSLENKKVFP